MPRVNIPLSNGFYQSQSLAISSQEAVNWYVAFTQPGSITEANVFGTPGISEITSTGSAEEANRGAHVKDNVPYFLNGETLYRLDRAFDEQGQEIFSTVALGTIPGKQRCSFADNGTQLMVLVPGGEGYIIDENSVPEFQQITDPDFKANGNPQYVVFVDSFFVVTTDTKKFIKSESNDGLNWNALDIGTAESDPDAIVAPVVYNNELYIAGTETFESFRNTGAGGFPFQRTGLFIQNGVFAPLSLIETNNTFFWVGGGTNESPAVWQLSGSTPVKVSTDAIESVLQGFTDEDVESCFSWAYAQKGAYFVGFNFPDKCFVYDTISQRWHERESQIINARGGTEFVPVRINSLVTAYGRVLCGDSQDGRIGEVSPDVYTEYGRPIIRTVSLPALFDQGNAFAITALEVTVESGVGNDAKADPELRMATSRDGKIFGDFTERKIGKIGKYSQRVVWRKLGRFGRLCIVKLQMSDPVKPVIVRVDANIKQGNRVGN